MAPNFKEWIESYGLECIPIGPDLKEMTGGSVPGKPVLPSREQLQQLADQMVRGQFEVIAEAAGSCDLIVAAGALQIVTRSIAERQNIPYVFAAYCPAVLPSSKHPPPKMGGHYSHSLSETENEQLWKEDEESFDKFGAVLMELHRAQVVAERLTSEFGETHITVQLLHKSKADERFASSAFDLQRSYFVSANG